MRTFRLHTSLWLDKPLEGVFEFFADAHNLQEITPPFLSFEVLAPRPVPMHVGQTIDYRLRVRGLPLSWRSEITAWEPPYRFVDEQVRGPYRAWVHEHRFSERDGKTLAEDSVCYAVPGGSLVHRLFVERDVRKIFEYRKQRLEELFGRVEAGDIPRAA